ncbi:hypothetical protein M8J71_17720 [Pseudarthrobacter sp. R1]|uniref:hypothetical protein n=1 Tax=Pseudarthrobacter sp. R1 TaxID=2944934 RepID=UPI00210B1F8C|nr:hypothetical protein [Pseudarthrobacter sp. R1]MCQ6272307.1 hypothetical protein [Pseudarthrobacter sp. R1]
MPNSHRWAHWPLTVDDVQVCAANTCSSNFHQHLPGSRGPDLNLLETYAAGPLRVLDQPKTTDDAVITL